MRAVVISSLAAGLALLAVASGCQNELFQDAETPFTIPANQLRGIEPVDLKAVEQAPPVQAEEAMKRAVEGGFQPTQYEGVREVNIAQVRAMALTNNLDLRVQLVAPDIAKTVVNEELAKFEAVFFANYNRNGNSLLTDLQLGEPLASDQANVGVRVPLATGGTLTFTPSYTATNGNNAALLGPNTDQGGLFFSISQPLLRGAGVETNTASIRAAKLNSQVTDARTKLEAIRILANADRAYWNLYRAYRELDVRKQQYELATAQMARARRRVEGGDAPEVEVLRAESGVGSTLENVILADAALRNRQRDLKRIINDPTMPMDDGTGIVPATQPNPVGLQLDANAMSAEAVRNRMEMLELELQLALDATDIQVARNATLPLFTVDYEYQLQGQGSSFSNAWSNLGNDDQYTLALRAEIPIGNEVALNRLRRAVLTRVQRLASRDTRAQSIRQEVLNAVDSLETAWQRILAARLETVLAARTYEAEKRQFEVGLRTSTDVLDAATRLGDAQSREVNALAGYEIALVDAAFATGTLVGGTRVRWDDINIDNPVKQSERQMNGSTASKPATPGSGDPPAEEPKPAESSADAPVAAPN
jgi:outer membrane protein TolC